MKQELVVLMIHVKSRLNKFMNKLRYVYFPRHKVVVISRKKFYSAGLTGENIHLVMWLKTATVSISEKPRRRPE